jgi:branched-chain amino acid transport system substrate-binding protein
MKNKTIWLALSVIVIIAAIILTLRLSFKTASREHSIRIGAILPLTGNAGKYGQYIKQALELAREEINQSGGINGENLHIIYEDDLTDPKTAAASMSKLAEVDRVPIVFGSWASSSVLAQAPIAERTRTPILAEAQSPQIRDAGDYVFRIQPDSRYYLKALVPYVYNELNI